MVIPNNHQLSTTKKSWISFFNEEAEEVVRECLELRRDSAPQLFSCSSRELNKIWLNAREKTGINITPQVLREWFCCGMARLGVQDRYVDAFCGRVPRSILARHYTDYSLVRLKEIYDNSNLKVPS